jgi:hypothetical protein
MVVEEKLPVVANEAAVVGKRAPVKAAIVPKREPLGPAWVPKWVPKRRPVENMRPHPRVTHGHARPPPR